MVKQLFFLLFIGLFACSGKGKQSTAVKESRIVAAEFSSDSAYRYVADQLSFGPRIPNTQPHADCADFLVELLKVRGAEVSVQQGEMFIYDGTKMPLKNIIASFYPEKKNRVLLFAHWDTRPWADQDPDFSNLRKPILGADDGASGVGVLLEIARQLSLREPEIGVDIILFDLEDMGTPEFYVGPTPQDTWALGSLYWSKNVLPKEYKARWGVLLDMVGGSDSRFYKEGFSMRQNPTLVNRLWQLGEALGYGHIFVDQMGGYAIDDHLNVHKAGIPSIDIIPYSTQHSFTPVWHTIGDDLSGISKETLQAIGQTVLTLIYMEKN